MVILVAFIFLLSGLTFIIYSLLNQKISQKNAFPDGNQSIDVYEFVSALGQQCPVGLINKWNPVDIINSIPCWKKGLDFTILNKKFNIYGATVKISSSAKKILLPVEDINLWKAWNIVEHCEDFTVQKLSSEGLTYDKHMQYDQIINKDPLYHRFGNVENNNVGWILLWNVHNLSWSFFLAQPIDEFEIGYNYRDRCLLTMIHCSNLKDIPNFISSSLINIREFASMSKLQIRPFCQSSPVISLVPVEDNNAQHGHKNFKYHLLKQRSRSRSISQANSSSFVYTLVPFAYQKVVDVSSMKGFLLIPKYASTIHDDSASFNAKPAKSSPSKKRSNRRHRTLSTSSDFHKNGERMKETRSQSVLENPQRNTTVSQYSDSEINKESSTANFLKSMLFGKNLYKDEFKDEKISKDDSNLETTDVAPLNKFDENKPVNEEKLSDDSQSESSSFEILLPFLAPEDLEKFKNVGKKCVSEFLSDLGQASSIDLNSSVTDQIKNTGGWKYDGIAGSNVVSLLKYGTFCGMKTVSYLTKGVIPTTTDKVWKAVQNPLTRFTYDDTVKKIIVLRKLNHGQKLLHMYHESSTLLKKESKDFCILQTEHVDDNKMIVAIQSVDYDKCPFMQDVHRGLFLHSGWVVESLPQDSTGVSCSVSYLAQLVINADSFILDEIINTQSQCISNLRNYLCPDIA